MAGAWIERRVRQADDAVKGTSNAVPDSVAAIFKLLLAEDLQYRLKPEELKVLVRRLATANNPASE